MIFTGLSKQCIDQLLECYGKKCQNDIHNEGCYVSVRQHLVKGVFPETKYGIRFLPFVLETIKKSHTTLPYILRQQYRNAHSVYAAVLKIPQELKDKRDIENYCSDIWKRVQGLGALSDYFEDVAQYLIAPVFKKFGYFSPSMMINIFVGLLLHLGEAYESQFYGLVWKHHVKQCYAHANINGLLSSLGNIPIVAMVTDEQRVWGSS